MANDCIPLFEEGDRIPCVVATGQSVVGKTFVQFDSFVGPAISDSPLGAENIRCRTAAAAGASGTLGVAAWDAAAGTPVTVIGGARFIVPVTAGAAITAGQQLDNDAAGKVIPHASGVVVGQAMTAAASGADCYVRLA